MLETYNLHNYQSLNNNIDPQFLLKLNQFHSNCIIKTIFRALLTLTDAEKSLRYVL